MALSIIDEVQGGFGIDFKYIRVANSQTILKNLNQEDVEDQEQLFRIINTNEIQ